jgi:hypothetical protein
MPLWKASWQFFIKLNIFFPSHPEIELLDIYPKELKTYFHTKTYTWIFIAALFIILKTWKLPRRPSGGEWLRSVHPDTWNIIQS